MAQQLSPRQSMVLQAYMEQRELEQKKRLESQEAQTKTQAKPSNKKPSIVDTAIDMGKDYLKDRAKEYAIDKAKEWVGTQAATTAGTTAASTGASAAGTAGATAAGTSAASILGPIAGLYGGYQTAKMINKAPSGGKRNTMGAAGGAASGAAIGMAFGPLGALVGAGLGASAGALASKFGSSKGGYQMMRDGGRKHLVENGILDANYEGSLADGSKFNFGKDKIGFGKGGGHNLDLDDETTRKVIGLTNVLAAGEGYGGKGNEAMSALYAQGALSNAGGDYNKAKENVLAMARQRGMDFEGVQGRLKELQADQSIDDNHYQAFSGGANELFGGPTIPAATTPDAGSIKRWRETKEAAAKAKNTIPRARR